MARRCAGGRAEDQLREGRARRTEVGGGGGREGERWREVRRWSL